MRFLSNKEYLLLFIASVLSALSCLMFSSNGSTPASIAISVIYIILSQFLPLEQQLYFVALALPNTKALGFGGISCSIVICAISGVRHYLQTKEKTKIPWGVVVYLLYCIQFYLRFDDIMIGLVMPIKQVMNMLFFAVLASDRRISGNAFLIGFKSSIFLFFGIVSSFFSSSFTINSMGRMAVAGNDPNILAIEAAFVLSFVCLVYVRLKNLSLPVFSVVLVLLSLVIILSGSRMGFVVLAVVLITTVLFNMKKVGRIAGLSFILIFGAGVFLASKYGQSIIETVMFRMELLEANDNVSNGRFEIWDLYINVLNTSPLLWLFGMGDYTQYGIVSQAHYFFIEDLAGYGIIGLLILYPTYYTIYHRLYKNASIYGGKPKQSLYRFLPLLVPLIGGLTLHGLVSIMNTTMLFLGTLALAKMPERAHC